MKVLPRKAAAANAGPLQPAIEAYQRGDVEQALLLAGQQVAVAPAGEFSAHAVLCEVLHRANRIDELADFLDLADDFQQDPRGRLMRAKLARRHGDLALAERLYGELLTADTPGRLYRMAAFGLVDVLGQQGRHADSWQAAEAAHAHDARPFPTDQLVNALRVVAEAPAPELARLPTARHRAPYTACVLGLPRSGTTLLEQILDMHSRVSGVGELPLAGRLADEMAQHGGWPGGAMRVPRPALDDMQRRYRLGSRGPRQLPDNVWAFDKTVFPMMQPLFIAAVLPGAKVLRITRDARDNATSLFMTNMDPSWGWTQSLAAIRQVIDAERRYMPAILDKLKLDVVTLRFEDLVDDPETHIRRVLAHLQLDWEPACLRPQDNARVVLTPSFEQVRRPINRQGIGRWRRHEQAFGADWDGLP